MELRLSRKLYQKSAIEAALADFGLKARIRETELHYVLQVPDAREFANYVLGTMKNKVD